MTHIVAAEKMHAMACLGARYPAVKDILVVNIARGPTALPG